jgi:hypothetical protein
MTYILGRAPALPAVARVDWSTPVRSLEAPDSPHQLVLMHGASTGQNPIMEPLQLKRQVGPVRHHGKHLRARPPFYHTLPGWRRPPLRITSETKAIARKGLGRRVGLPLVRLHSPEPPREPRSRRSRYLRQAA